MLAFSQPVFDMQRVFRVVLDAMSRPARLCRLPVFPQSVPDGLSPVLADLALTLCDGESPLWLSPGLRKDETTAAVRSSKRRTRRPSRWWRTLPNCRPCPLSRRAFPLTPTVPQPSCLPVWPLMREPVSVVPAPASAGKVPSPARCPKILRSGGARIRRASRSAWTCCCAAPTAWPVCRAPRALNVCLRRVRHVCSGQRWGKGHFRRP